MTNSATPPDGVAPRSDEYRLSIHGGDYVHEVQRFTTAIGGLLHLFAAVAIPILLAGHDFELGVRLNVWVGAKIALGAVSFVAVVLHRQGRHDLFRRLIVVETVVSATTFGSLAWLDRAIPSHDAARYLLIAILLALTALAGTDSSLVTTGRSLFVWTVLMVSVSYCVAFLFAGETLFAVFCILWSGSVVGFSRAGQQMLADEIEQRRRSEETARHDDLTALLTRSAFVNDLRSTIVDLRGDHALVLIDLDGFKAINDGFGHAAGDAVLKAVAGRLTANFPGTARLGRLGGDEFAALVPLEGVDLPTTLERVLDSVSEPVVAGGRDIYVAGSIGWTYLDPASSASDAIAEADAAMYASKNSATSTTTGFSPAMRNELDRDLDLRQRFRSAIRRGAIAFEAQPIVRAGDRVPVAVELLARWPADDDLQIGSEEFNRLADETGLAVDLDRLALAQAAELLERWRDQPDLDQIVVKANVSPLHLHNLALARSIRELIPDVDRDRLGLEFVEDRLITLSSRHHVLLRDLKAMGVTISIDDFGIGYSSLAYLRNLPISEVKIDRSFVTRVDSDVINQGLLGAIIDLASTLGLTTVAEGIENERELETVRKLGVGSVQGYFTGRPVDLDQIGDLLRADNNG